MADTSTIVLDKKESEAQHKTYGYIEDMISVKNRRYKQFNGPDGDRNWVEYLDDSDRRLNGYTPTRQEQDKEEWQENLFDPVTRSKMRGLIASVALTPPEMIFKVWNKKGLFSGTRAEFLKRMVQYVNQITNPKLEIFWEGWDAAARGTIIKYQGYLKSKIKRKIITKFDPVTGEVEFNEKEVIAEDRPIDVEIPVPEFYMWSMFIDDIQDQPRVAWIKKYTKKDLEFEFNGYKNFEKVKDKKTLSGFSQLQETYFYKAWQSRTNSEDDYEVAKIYDLENDNYEIWANGVPLLMTPMLWGKKRKRIPMSKTIFEPFESRKFFAGKSFPHTIEGLQDADNTLVNSILDKLYRSLKKPLLVGLANKDLFDVESEIVNQDDKIYVPDVSQVKELPFEGVSTGDIAMLQMIARKGDLASLEPQQSGVSGRGEVTAREFLVTDAHAQKIKGIFFNFLEDLWLQKSKNAIEVVRIHLMQPQEQIINIEDVEMSDGTKGMLGIQIAKSKSELPSELDIEAMEEAMMREGINYKRIGVTADFLDDWEEDVQVVPESLYAKDQAKQEALTKDKLQGVVTYFPEYFISNKDKFFKEFLQIYGDSVDKYNPPAQAPPPAQGEEAGEEGGLADELLNSMGELAK